ncbi:MAG TPA: UDP-glucose/GDP-mannose dehydrogenase family protein [Terriglobia bacterium]|nr:UDP-glucose/GDP-mannose dehydrogenase family protein [Terriglobia bacterium]
MSSISVFGLGYVGSVTAACFARMGHSVLGVDLSRPKVEMIEAGRSPIVEAQMSELTAAGRESGRLRATTDVRRAIAETEVSFVSVGTPSLHSGKLDLSHVERVAAQIGEALKCKQARHTVVLRSTMLPGSTESLVIPGLEKASGRRAGADFAVAYNPEFMREGSAVEDFLTPPYTVLGARTPDDLGAVRELYREMPGEVFATGIPVAEMVKYVCNAFHALKVGFANEIGALCKGLDADAEMVNRIFTSDKRLNISPAYLSPGFAFGGSCLPKDLRALTHRARELDVNLPLLESILQSNARHLDRAVEAVLATKKRKVGMLGLSFKSGTDDLRESPQVQLIKRLLGEGCQVSVWDPQVSLGQVIGSNRQYIEQVIPHIGSLLSADFEEVIKAAEVVIIGTRSVDNKKLAACLGPEQHVIDLVNLEASRRLQHGARYDGICW